LYTELVAAHGCQVTNTAFMLALHNNGRTNPAGAGFVFLPAELSAIAAWRAATKNNFCVTGNGGAISIAADR